MDHIAITDAAHRPIYAWTKGVPVEEHAVQQLKNIASMPFIHHHVAAMPDMHLGLGATVGSVIATKGAVIPAAVGVDLGCGMMAVQTSLTSHDLPESLGFVRSAIESRVPHGRTDNGQLGKDSGSFKDIGRMPQATIHRASALIWRYEDLVAKHPGIEHRGLYQHMGTLGTGNHFIEICLDEQDKVWIMLHSGSRGIGNKIGSYFINLAKKDMQRWFINLPDKDLAYIPDGSDTFHDYVEAVEWAQDYAAENRRAMMDATIEAMRQSISTPFHLVAEAVNCHHNYISRENHYGHNVIVTRKGAVRARKDDLGIIPGSMGAKSFIVRGKGNKESFCSCSHGAGRVMSRTAAKKMISLEDHAAATKGIECRKDLDILDESPAAYKDIDAVMAAQSDLVEIVATLRQIVNVKG